MGSSWLSPSIVRLRFTCQSRLKEYITRKKVSKECRAKYRMACTSGVSGAAPSRSPGNPEDSARDFRQAQREPIQTKDDRHGKARAGRPFEKHMVCPGPAAPIIPSCETTGASVQGAVIPLSSSRPLDRSRPFRACPGLHRGVPSRRSPIRPQIAGPGRSSGARA